jgi:hypothetical protein
VRSNLLSLLGVTQLYELDRLDLTVRTTLDMRWQTAVSGVLERMGDRAFLEANGFGDTRLLGSGDPSAVIYTFTLLETTPLGNVIRVQTDSYDGPLNLSAGGRLELGSTAKLRTLISYLEVVEELHEGLSPLSGESLRVYPVAQSRAGRWTTCSRPRGPTRRRGSGPHCSPPRRRARARASRPAEGCRPSRTSTTPTTRA